MNKYVLWYDVYLAATLLAPGSVLFLALSIHVLEEHWRKINFKKSAAVWQADVRAGDFMVYSSAASKRLSNVEGVEKIGKKHS